MVRGRNTSAFVTFLLQTGLGDIKIEWCPTEDMTGDFWTKPLQGALFKKFRDLIMGVMPQPLPRGQGHPKPRTKIRTLRSKGPNQMSAGVCWRTMIRPHVALKDLRRVI